MGIKNVSLSEDWFRDHFPGEPIMPGVLLIETIAQTGAILIDVTTDYAKLALMTAVERAKFLRPARPADQLLIEVDLLHLNDISAKVSGIITRGRDKIVTAEIFYVLDGGKGEAALFWRKLSKQITAGAEILETAVEPFEA